MESPQPEYIWQHPRWPALSFDAQRVGVELARARRAQALVEGKLGALGFRDRQDLAAEAWTQEAVSTAAIEGEQLDLLAVRSSVARRLGGLDAKGPNAPRHIDGLLDIMDDAVAHAGAPLTHERLQAWQAALFPSGFSGMRRIRVGHYREHAEAMQIVSGREGREKVHYEAPPSDAVTAQMDAFLAWFNGEAEPDRLLQAALAHLWFETIHPFEDGNGRVGRVIVDLALAREAGEASRLVRISQRLLEERDTYYEQLERAQHGALDVTPWVLWFVTQVRVAWERACDAVELTLAKARFWLSRTGHDLNARQRKVINVLLDAGPGGFEGGMSTRKYESLTGTSRATASRELLELLALGFLHQTGAGRSTRYYVAVEGWAPAATP